MSGPFTLKKHLLSKIPFPGRKQHYFHIMEGKTKAGYLVAEPQQGGKHVSIEGVKAKGGPNSLGPSVVSNLKSQLKQHFPGAKTTGGHRSSGARRKFMAKNREALAKLDDGRTDGDPFISDVDPFLAAWLAAINSKSKSNIVVPAGGTAFLSPEERRFLVMAKDSESDMNTIDAIADACAKLNERMGKMERKRADADGDLVRGGPDNPNLFPSHNGEPLSWSIGVHHSINEENAGYPKMRAVIRAMAKHRPEQLANEHRELVKSSMGKMFGHQAKKQLNVVEEEMGRMKMGNRADGMPQMSAAVGRFLVPPQARMRARTLGKPKMARADLDPLSATGIGAAAALATLHGTSSKLAFSQSRSKDVKTATPEEWARGALSGRGWKPEMQASQVVAHDNFPGHVRWTHPDYKGHEIHTFNKEGKGERPADWTHTFRLLGVGPSHRVSQGKAEELEGHVGGGVEKNGALELGPLQERRSGTLGEHVQDWKTYRKRGRGDDLGLGALALATGGAGILGSRMAHHFPEGFAERKPATTKIGKLLQAPNAAQKAVKAKKPGMVARANKAISGSRAEHGRWAQKQVSKAGAPFRAVAKAVKPRPAAVMGDKLRQRVGLDAIADACEGLRKRMDAIESRRARVDRDTSVLTKARSRSGFLGKRSIKSFPQNIQSHVGSLRSGGGGPLEAKPQKSLIDKTITKQFGKGAAFGWKGKPQAKKPMLSGLRSPKTIKVKSSADLLPKLI
jgi:hypothetical protein